MLGAVLVLLAVPNAIKAFSEARPPRLAIGMLLIGGAMFVSALILHPEGYSFADIPDALMRVLMRILRFFEE